MIVRQMPNEQLLCIHQTSHALMAAEFCRHWGNVDFAPPVPYSPVLLAISQHDNGWTEWERQPQLRADGYPIDFMHDTDVLGKLALWRRGIDRAYAQHPYAAVLIGRHAASLYESDMANITDETVRGHVAEFIADQQLLLEMVRYHHRGDAEAYDWLRDAAVESNTRLLQFGDRASLQVCVPWQATRRLDHCPVDGRGEFAAVQMQFDETHITFDPWPFGVDHFEVSMHGWLLAQRIFADETAYHDALVAAPLYRKTWTVCPLP